MSCLVWTRKEITGDRVQIYKRVRNSSAADQRSITYQDQQQQIYRVVSNWIRVGQKSICQIMIELWPQVGYRWATMGGQKSMRAFCGVQFII